MDQIRSILYIIFLSAVFRIIFTKDWWQFGWQIQREINKTLTLGTEIYYKTANTADSSDTTGYSVGAIINFTETHH